MSKMDAIWAAYLTIMIGSPTSPRSSLLAWSALAPVSVLLQSVLQRTLSLQHTATLSDSCQHRKHNVMGSFDTMLTKRQASVALCTSTTAFYRRGWDVCKGIPWECREMAFPLNWLNSFLPIALRTTTTIGVKGPVPDLLPILVTCRVLEQVPETMKTCKLVNYSVESSQVL